MILLYNLLFKKNSSSLASSIGKREHELLFDLNAVRFVCVIGDWYKILYGLSLPLWYTLVPFNWTCTWWSDTEGQTQLSGLCFLLPDTKLLPSSCHADGHIELELLQNIFLSHGGFHVTQAEPLGIFLSFKSYQNENLHVGCTSIGDDHLEL